MGLDTSHDCWHGAYSDFMRWRCAIAKAAGLPPLELMEGFYETDPQNPSRMPIKWACLKPDPLHVLLYHSDCDGEIAPGDCGPIADRLEALLPLLPKGDSGDIGDLSGQTQQFIDGLRRAVAADESVEFQ